MLNTAINDCVSPTIVSVPYIIVVGCWQMKPYPEWWCINLQMMIGPDDRWCWWSHKLIMLLVAWVHNFPIQLTKGAVVVQNWEVSSAGRGQPSWTMGTCRNVHTSVDTHQWIARTGDTRWYWNLMYSVALHAHASRDAYRYTIWSRYRYYPIAIQGIEMTHSKWYSKSILNSSIWEKSNNNITKYHHANHKIPVYSNKMRKFDMWTLPWQALWQFPLHMITAPAVAVGFVWCSWWQFSTFQCRIASLWIIRLCGYRDMDRIDIGIEIWYQYWYRYWKICNDMQPYMLVFWLTKGYKVLRLTYPQSFRGWLWTGWGSTGLRARVRNRGRLENRSHVVSKTVSRWWWPNSDIYS